MREFDIRRWAPGMLLFMALALGATAVQAQNLQEPPMEGEAMPANTDDPYENWNRKVYAFNDAIDTHHLTFRKML